MSTQDQAGTEGPVAREVVVHGEVQAVGFRDSCRREAAGAGVTGWVENQVDGTVRTHVEGAPEAVRTMLTWLENGPRHAQVSRTEVRETPVQGFDRFEVR